MKGPALLAHHAGVLRTRVGACWPGHRAVFRGHDLHRDLGGIGWLDLYLFGLTGRRFDAPQLQLLQDIWSMTSYPDARLWNNRVGALAASARSSPALGLAAALAVTEAGIYGGGPGIRAIDFFLRAGRAVEGGADIEDVVAAELATRHVLGYGRPIDSHDERLPSLVARTKALGLDGGRHYRLAFDVQDILLRHKPFLRMNFAGLTAALAADFGFTPRQYQLFNLLKTLAGMPPCIVEAAGKPEGAMFPTPCSDIAYEGAPRRKWLGRDEPATGR